MEGVRAILNEFGVFGATMEVCIDV